MLKLVANAPAECPPGLLELAKSLDENIAAAVKANLHETAALLHMAKLDLLTRIHGISEEEMDNFLFVAKTCAAIARDAPEEEDVSHAHK